MKEFKHLPSLESLGEEVKKETEEARIRKEARKRYSFLEQVPDWEEKLRWWELEELFVKKVMDNSLFSYNKDVLVLEADIFNKSYGEEVASVKEGKFDPLIEHPGYRLVITVPREKYEDILDENNNVLPSKTQS